MPSAQNNGGYRRTGDASGPTSSHAEYTATLDPGKNSSVSGGGIYGTGNHGEMVLETSTSQQEHEQEQEQPQEEPQEDQ